MDQNTLRNPDDILKESMERIYQLLEEKKYFMVKDELLKFNDADIAEMFEELLEDPDDIEKIIVVYRLLPKDVSVEVFSYLPSDDQLKIVDGITDKELSYIVGELDFDDKIDILEELPANLVDKILEKTPKNERQLINNFLNYPDTCAGSLMTPEYISLQKDMTVGEALAHIKKEGMGCRDDLHLLCQGRRQKTHRYRFAEHARHNRRQCQNQGHHAHRLCVAECIRRPGRGCRRVQKIRLFGDACC